MHSLPIPYDDSGIQLEGFAAYQTSQKHPLVILCHAWRGRDDLIAVDDCRRNDCNDDYTYTANNHFAVRVYNLAYGRF